MELVPALAHVQTPPERSTLLVPDQHIARVLALSDDAGEQPGRLSGRQVFQAVDCKVDAAFEQGALDFQHENAVAADSGERHGGVAITQSMNLFGLHIQLRPLLA